ncbi:MAG TPA: ABC transporter permease [candidate division Zixibacteria bacterium]|nr:ABC transporter permease [candidate division Zixibacteria bacterium]
MYQALYGLIKKEFIQVFRDKNMLRLIFLLPIIQLLLFGYVVNFDVKNLDLDVYDFDHSSQSRELIQTTSANNYFKPNDEVIALKNLENNFKNSSSDMAIIIPNDFSEKLMNKDKPTISLITDGSNANSTSIGIGYMLQIMQLYTQNYYNIKPKGEIRFDVLYNPEAESVYFMVPGIVATLLTMITVMLTAMAIVREKEVGTLEQLLVTPIKGWVLLLGKIIPFALLGLLEIIIALTFGVLWFKVPFVGSSVLLFSLSGLYLITPLGIGLFFSNITSTQQQAMFFAWFFSVFAILTSGFFTPITNMPIWMQYITYLNPMRYFMEIVRAIMMKGAGLQDLTFQVVILTIYGISVFGLSALRFSKRIS